MRDILIKASNVSIVKNREIFQPACRTLGILDEDERLISIVSSNWRRGGAETYILTADIDLETEDGKSMRRSVIAKAYAGLGLGVSPEERIENWRRRAEILSRAGVPTPEVFSIFDGLLFMQYIDESLTDVLQPQISSDSVEWAAECLIDMTTKLDSLSLLPTCLLGDLRTDLHEIYITDFGEDLGEVPGSSSDNRYCEKLVIKELERHEFHCVKDRFLHKLETQDRRNYG